MGTFKFLKTIKSSVILSCRHIICYIYIPPGGVVVDAVPGVGGKRMIVGCTVNNIARDVLTAAEGGEEIGEVVADPFMGA